MPRHFSRPLEAARVAMITAIVILVAFPTYAGGVTGQATEWTQLANNAELISLVGKSAEQVNNQITQISQLAEQIQNQINIYKNLLQNTAQLPNHIWGQVENDLSKLQNIVAQGQGVAFSMGNIDDVLKQRFQSFADMKTNLPDGQSFSSTYQGWSDTNRDTIAGTLKAANLTAEQFSSEEFHHVLAALSVGERRRPDEGPAGRASDRHAAGGADAKAARARLAADDDDGHMVPVRAGTEGSGPGPA